MMHNSSTEAVDNIYSTESTLQQFRAPHPLPMPAGVGRAPSQNSSAPASFGIAV